MQAILVMFRSDGERRSFSVTRDMTVIGRREDCDLRIPLGEISRKHARLVRDGDSLRLEDLGSSNGTFLNGQRVQESVVTPGDSIQIGPVVFVLQVDGYPADEDLRPIIADSTDHMAPEASAPETGPLSPTSQSELDDLGHLEPLPAHDDELGGVGLEPLSLGDDAPAELAGDQGGLEMLPAGHESEELELAPVIPPKAKSPAPPKPAAPAKSSSEPIPLDEEELDLGSLAHLDQNATLELTPDEHPSHHGDDEPIDLDFGLDSPQKPHA